MAYNFLNNSYLTENKDPWGINAHLIKLTSNIQSVLKYSPWNTFNSPFILALEFSKKEIHLLLKNGIVIKIGSNNGKPSSSQIEKMYLTQEYPRQLIFPTKIIDISCGLEHTLAKGKDMKVYSWGSNFYGQLGLNPHDVSYKNYLESSIITQLASWKITQIYATDYNSFCLTSDNTLFGFGNNEQGQLIFPGESKISTPVKIGSFNTKENDIKIMINKKGNKLYYMKMLLPIKTFNKSIEINQNYQNTNEEYKLITEVRQLREQLNYLMKGKHTSKDNEYLINKIEQLIIKFEEKSNKRQMEYKTIRNELDPERSYDKLIEILQNKKGTLINHMITKDLTTLNSNIIDYPFNKASSNEYYLSKDNQQFLLNHSSCLASLLEGASSNIQIQKTKYIENYYKETKMHAKHLKKNKDYINYIQLFKEVIEEIKYDNKQYRNQDSLSEVNNIKQKLSIELHNFLHNTLEGTTSNVCNRMTDLSLSLNDYNNQSSTNLRKLSEKMNNLAINTTSNDVMGKKILNIFDKNIVLVNQNNYLTHFILNTIIGNVYNYTVEKTLKYYNPFDYKEIRNNVEQFKQLYEEREEQRIRNQIKANIINCYHYKTGSDEDYIHNSELNSEDELN